MVEGESVVYKETENYRAVLQHSEGYMFFHLDVDNWSPSLFKEFKEEWPKLKQHVLEEGYDILFTYSKDKKSTKMWNLIQKCTEIRKFGPRDNYYLGAWDLEEK